MRHRAPLLASAFVLATALHLGCSEGTAASPPGPDAGADVTSPSGDGAVDSGIEDAATTSDTGSSPGDAGPPVAVSFAYTPQWGGVKKVEVVGGFGLGSDWSKTESLVTLAASGAGAGGAWKGTAMLPPGTYLYLFRVVGDDAAAPAATYERYAVDPLQTAFAPCPMASPTYSKVDVNPCSQIAVGTSGGPTPAAPLHVKGTVHADGAAAGGWLVVIERNEPKSHHYFANRATTGAGGTFDLIGSAGAYRLQVQVPTFLSTTDLDRDPSSVGTLRRAISATIDLKTADVTAPVPDVAFHDYGAFAPWGDAGSLPTAFSFEPGPARLDVYGGPGDGGVVEIGDPWFTSVLATDGGASFGGTFDTMQAMQDAAAPGTRYMWGTEQPFGADAGLAWTNQSLVLPIAWQ